jgi:tetratricopeptide (TPR) repeat protein
MRQAHSLLRSLPPHVPDPAANAYVLGNTALALGNLEQARDCLESAVRLRPGWGPAWLTLTSMVDLSCDDSLAERLLGDRGVAERQSPPELARFHYALGKLHIDRREPERAFASFSEGANLLHKATPYSRHANAANARASMSGYTAELLCGAQGGHGADSGSASRVIFVTGLPRSGTTLVEQILTSHSQVGHGAELNLLQHAAVRAGGVSGDDLRSFLASGGTLQELADLYLHLVAERFGATGRVVDKTVDASRFMGLIASVLPRAPLIWMQRDPLDNAWSCFRTFFIHGVAWSYDLTDIAHHFRLEDELRQYWQERLGNRLLVVPYADLVQSPANWTRRLLAHCGLSEEPGVFSPHTSKRIVLTASALQVRKPVNLSGLGVAGPFRQWLGPFIQNYGVSCPPRRGEPPCARPEASGTVT